MRAILFHTLCLTGCYTHMVTPYEQKEDCIGYGKELRHKLSPDASVQPKIRNRLTVQTDDEGNARLAGKGFLGYKGRYHHENAYNPTTYQVRRGSDNAQMEGKRRKRE